MILKVKRGGSIVGPDNKHYKSGDVIPSGLLSAKQIQEHLKSGFLQASRPAARALSLEEIASVASDEDFVENAPGSSPVAGISESGNPVAVNSRWDLDPDGLRGMTLDQLNVMILERDDSVEPLETVEEAVEWLSQDFKPAA
jgi:hypothetical protein